MTKDREAHLLNMIRTITEPGEMREFVGGLKQQHEYTPTILEAVSLKCQVESWPAP